ncbi:MAG: hypothetical protein RL250_1766 [Verrucomicrobiota bacterium]|jgi:uncharacterized membrane protein
MGFFATLNPEQLGRVQRARSAQGPFDIGACFDAAFAALKRDFWNIVLVHLVGALLSCFIVTSPPLLVGISRFNAKVLQGLPAGFDDLFSGFDDFGSAFLMMLVMLPLLLIGFFLCFVPGYYLAIAWTMAWGLLADRRGTFWECLEMSRQAVTAHWGWAFLLLFVANLVSGLGVIACGIGILATLPLHSLMVEAAYQRLFPEPPAV